MVMKKLFGTDKKKSVATSANKQPVSSNKDVQAFLSKVATMSPKAQGSSGLARLVFALDVTASRQATWDSATQLQSEMFVSTQDLGTLNVQLCYFRGLGEFFHSDWQHNGDDLLRIMSGIQCQAGATQLGRLLKHVIAENESEKIRGVVFIGDAMEENLDLLAQQAGKLGLLNITLFIFQERGDPAARKAFVELCRLSGGAYSQFDSASADQLRELLRAVAIYATGGLRALKDFSKASGQTVKLLEQQLNR